MSNGKNSKRNFLLDKYRSFKSSTLPPPPPPAAQGKSDYFELVLVDIKATINDQLIRAVKKNMYDEDLRYICISYRWGELLEQAAGTPDYTCHVISFRLTDLILLCKYFSQEPDLKDINYVWVDTISIDQSNHERKKATIYRMSEIYRTCDYIVAVPDLHFGYLIGRRAYRERADFISEHTEYVYHCLRRNESELDKLDQQWLKELEIPQREPEEIRKLLDDTYIVENILELENVDELDDVSAGNLLIEAVKNDPKMAFFDQSDKWIDSDGASDIDDNVEENDTTVVKQDNVLLALKKEEWKRRWQARHQQLGAAFEYMEDVLQEYRNRVWVVSEYCIARERACKRMKLWLINLCSEGDPVLGLPFIDLNFRDSISNVRSFEIDYRGLKHGLEMGTHFSKKVVKSLSNTDFLAMILCSKAMRQADRFFSVLPLHEDYKHLIVDKDTISNWNITDMLSVQLKLFEFLNLTDAVRLLEACADHSYTYRKELPLLPSFATFCEYDKLLDLPIRYTECSYEASAVCLNITQLKIGVVIDNNGIEKSNPNTHHQSLCIQATASYMTTFPQESLPDGFDAVCEKLGMPIDELVAVAIPIFRHTFNDKGLKCVGHVEKNIWVLFAAIKPAYTYFEDMVAKEGWTVREGECYYNIY